MKKDCLAKKLLSTGLFMDNKFFQDYLVLVTTIYNPSTYMEQHHILPRAYYEHNNLAVDSSNDNSIKLSYANHCKAHWLLYHCTLGYLKAANAHAVHYIQKLCTKLKIKNNITEADLEEINGYMDSIVNDPDSRYWSMTDIDLLKKYYPVEGTAVYKRFNNKSRYSCQHKANSLGLFAPISFWTEEELLILKKYYPLEGKAVYKRLNNRTADACARMARLYKLKHSRVWTDSEIAILLEYYPEEGSLVYLRLPGRSKATCVMKAKALNIQYKDSWTEEQLEALIKFYPTEGAVVGKRINKAAEACRQKASKLHICYKGDK